jgi:hypothetical protein
MKPHGIEVQISMLILAAVVYWLGMFVGGLFASATSHEPSTWLGEALWGIIPAAPFAVGFLVALGLWVYEMIGNHLSRSE